ncbi:MAG: N-acetyltransferase [Tannerellaceae bacterium]|nr:N-acetyltransferase [Tannerellaceae bacterium]
MVIDHTEVDGQFSGQGWGWKLVLECVKYARANHMKITPLCSFARQIFNQEPEIHDVLYPSGK